MATIFLFTYGSLRPGQPLEYYMQNATDCFPGTINGRLHDFGQGSFPVADLTTEGTIVGDIYEVDTDDMLVRECHTMEVNSGYEPKNVVATTVEGDKIGVVAYHFPHKEWYGPRIKSGDWIKHVRKNGQSSAGFVRARRIR